MKNTKVLVMGVSALLAMSLLAGCGKKDRGKDEYDEKGRLILNLKNVYFDSLEEGHFYGDDEYTEIINDKFQVKIKPSNYDYTDWDGQVNVAMNGDNLTDVIHYNLKSYNFGSTYEKWVKDTMIKAIPSDMSKWPNLNNMINRISNIDALKIDGKLYGIPIMNDIANPDKDFSNMTYVYRRDIVKEIDEANKGKADYTPLLKENDVYTWAEFERVVDAFRKYLVKTNGQIDDKKSPLVDEQWGFPSITNFYKDVPHCFNKDSNGRAINAFTSDHYINGLEKAKSYVDNIYYCQDQYGFDDGTATNYYLGGKALMLYDNLNVTNYSKLRKSFKRINKSVDLNDGTAIMKIKGPDGKFAIEGVENWFGITMFNYDISENKMEKILDIMEWLLTEEGTRFAIYGKEGYDYAIVDGEVELSDLGWERNSITGEYSPKLLGGKFLRYMATMGYDTKEMDPFTDKDSYNILKAWYNEMKQAKDNGQLRVIKTPSDVDWMSTPTKNDKTEGLLDDANTSVLQYAFNKKLTTIEAYKETFNTNAWSKTLQEINEKLGK